MSRRVFLGTPALLSVVLIGACGGGAGAPTALPVASTPPGSVMPEKPNESTSTPTGTPAQKAASDSPGVRRTSAQQFIDDWWSTVNAALVGAEEVEELEEFYDESCSVCADVQADVERARQDGKRQVDGELVKIQTLANDTIPGAISVISTVQPQPGKSVSREGRTLHSFSGGPPADFIFTLVREEQGWKVTDLVSLGPRNDKQ